MQSERRLDERKPVHLPAVIESQGAKCLAVMQDISRCGGRVMVNRLFPVGVDIRVSLGGGIERNCVVRRCVPIAGTEKFEVGFEVLGDTWPKTVVPANE